MGETFDASQHMMDVKGNAYLPVQGRVIWFRKDHPDWSIVTKPIEYDVEKGYAVFHASIIDAGGRVIGEGTKMETIKGFHDFMEKAETGAVGRALAYCGYGTADALDEIGESARPCDSPQARSQAQRPQQQRPQQRPAQTSEAKAPPASDSGVDNKRARLQKGIIDVWLKRASFESAFTAPQRRWNSIMSAHKQTLIAEPASTGEAKADIHNWLETASYGDLRAYGTYVQNKVRELEAQKAGAA